MRRALSFSAAIAVVVRLAGPAAADDFADCVGKSPDRSIRGCSNLLKQEWRSSEFLGAVYLKRGGSYSRNGQYDHAIADYDKAVILGARLVPALTGRGAAYLAKGQYDRAIADFDKAIKLNPRNVQGYAGRGLSYQLSGQHDSAIADFSEAIRTSLKYSFLYFNRAMAYEKMGQNDKAISDYQQMLIINPNNQSSMNALKRLGVAR